MKISTVAHRPRKFKISNFQFSIFNHPLIGKKRADIGRKCHTIPPV